MSHNGKNLDTSQDPQSASASKKLTFPDGLPGFPECQSFMVETLKEGFYAPLQVMISLDLPGLSFILYPHTPDLSLLPEQAYQEVKEQFQNMSPDIYSFVTVQEPNGHLTLTANLKAPIVVDKNTGKAWQYILTASSDQQFRVPLETLSENLRQKRKEAGIA